MDYLPTRSLSDGDTIGIFSPSEWLGDNRPERVHAGAEMLERQGFKVQYARNYLCQDTIRAGTVEQRTSDISELLDRPDVDALLATWGGKACNHLVSKLPYPKFATAQKPIIGFSDTCVLSNAISAKTGLVTFYGPNIAGKLDESTWSDFGWLRKDFPWSTTNLIGSVQNEGALTLQRGRVSGRLVGGNLNCFVLGNVLSEIYLSHFDGRIFLWEDLGLVPRQIDQFLTALVNCGFMDRIGGMVVGDFFQEESHEWLRSDPLESVMHALRDYDFPIVYAPNFGHRSLENPAFPIGATCTLDADDLTLVAEDQILT